MYQYSSPPARRLHSSLVPATSRELVRFFDAELPGIDAELLDPVLDDPFGRPEEFRRPGLVPAGFP